MKIKLSRSLLVFTLIILFTSIGKLYSQTSGTFSFSVTTTAPAGSYDSENLLAIWIENSQAEFIRTKIKFFTGDLDHLATWVSKSGQNVVDAVTGPTRTSHGTVTFLWNGTNINGTVVPDGSYSVWLEMAWDRSLTADKTVNSFPFTKGTSAFHSTPANTSNFLSVALDWTPLTTSSEDVLESKEIIVYPNPSSGLLNIDFKNPAKECLVQILNEVGRIEYSEKITDLQTGIHTFNLSRLPGGNYYCILHFPEKNVVFNLVLVK